MKNQEILERLRQLQSQIEELRDYILANEKEPSRRRKTKKIILHDYKPFFSWNQKIVFILNYYGRPLTVICNIEHIVYFLNT
jgi:hypothetical protein